MADSSFLTSPDNNFYGLAEHLVKAYKEKIAQISRDVVNSRKGLDEIRLMQGQVVGLTQALELIEDVLDEVRKKGFADE